MQYLCVLWSTSTHQCTHISGAPLLDHGDYVSQFHLQSERCLPLRLHLYVLPHLSHHRVHTLRQTDRQGQSKRQTGCICPGKCQVHVSRCVLPAYTLAAPEKLRTLQETLFWADRSTQRVDWWARTCTHTHTQLVYKLIYNWCITVNEPGLTWGLRWGSGLVQTWRPAVLCSGRTGSVPAGLCDGGDPQTSWWSSSSGFLPPSASGPVTHTGRHDFITNIMDCVNSSTVLIYWWHYARWRKY